MGQWPETFFLNPYNEIIIEEFRRKVWKCEKESASLFC
jgi:hypothetical protein